MPYRRDSDLLIHRTELQHFHLSVLYIYNLTELSYRQQKNYHREENEQAAKGGSAGEVYFSDPISMSNFCLPS